ncbi:MAG: LysR family transcriptional regulator, partial [Pseudomonadales bacterium]
AKVAECGGISAAARVLGMPKSKVSRRLAQLEEQLEVRLLERTTRAVSVTEAGRRFAVHCQRVAEEAASAQESVSEAFDVPRGVLRISASVAIGQYLLAPHLAEFRRCFPQIELDIELNNRRVDLIAENFDLVVRVGELQDSSLISRCFATARAGLYAAPSYLAARGEPRHLEALAEHDLLLMSAATNPEHWRFEQHAGKAQSLSVSPVLRINDFTSLRTLVADGAGIAQFPTYLVADLCDQGVLQQVLPQWCSECVNYYVLYPSRRGLTRKASAWIDFFTHKLAQAIPHLA